MNLTTLLTGGMLKGRRSYILGSLIALQAVARWAVGDQTLDELILKLPEILGGLGICSLRAGVASAVAEVVRQLRIQAAEAAKDAADAAKSNGAVLLLIVALAPALGACIYRFPAEDRLDDFTSEQEAQAEGEDGADDRNSLQVIADRTLPAETNKLRNVRICGYGAIGAEVMTDRARMFDPQDAAAALGHATTIINTISQIESAPTTPWYNAEMANVVIALTQAFSAGGKTRLVNALGRGLNVSNVLGSIERSAVSTFKGREMVRDIKHLMDEVRSGAMTYEEAWRSCIARIDGNREMLQVLNGARPSGSVITPQPAGS